MRSGVTESLSLEVFKNHMDVAPENRVGVLVDIKCQT